MTEKQKQVNRMNKWRDAKLNEGWKLVQVFVPAPLAEILRQQIRSWKYQNPSFYKQPNK